MSNGGLTTLSCWEGGWWYASDHHDLVKLNQSLGELTDLVKRINHHWKFKHPFGAEMDVHLDTKWMIKFSMVVYPL